MVFQSCCTNLWSHQVYKGFLFSMSLTIFVFCWWPFWQVWCDSSLCFWFAFPQWLVMLMCIFCCAWWPAYVFFGKETCLFTSLVHCLKFGCFVFWYWVIWTLYALDINPLLDIAIFSHSIGGLFASFLWIENELVSFLKCIGAVNEIEVVSVMSLWVIKLYCSQEQIASLTSRVFLNAGIPAGHGGMSTAQFNVYSDTEIKNLLLTCSLLAEEKMPWVKSQEAQLPVSGSIIS